MAVLENTSTRGPTRAERTGILALWGANGISAVGGQMTNVAIPWFILETTGSAGMTGLVATALILGGVASSVLSGPLVDRLGFKRTSVWTDGGSTVLIAAIPLLYAADRLPFWLMLLLAFSITCIQAPGDAARYAMVPALAQRAGMTMERANGIDRVIAKGAMLVGPLIGGLLVVAVGAANVMLVDAVTFAASMVLIALFVHPGSHEEGAATSGPPHAGQSYRAELLVGLRFIGSNRMLLSIVGVVAVANALDGSLMTVVLPVYALEVWDSPTSLGALMSAIGAGSLIGAAVFGAIGHRMPRRLTFLVAGAGGVLLLYGGLALTPPLGVMLILVVVGAIVAGPIVPLAFTVVQTITPPEIYGRVFAALQSMSSMIAPFAIATVGFVIEGVGVVRTIAGLGVVYLVVTLGMLLNPALRHMDADQLAPTP